MAGQENGSRSDVPAFHPAEQFSKVDVKYLKVLQQIQIAHKEKVITAKLEDVVKGLAACDIPPEAIAETLQNVDERRAAWKDRPFNTMDAEGTMRTLEPDELEHCLMISTYTDSTLFDKVSRKLNDPPTRGFLDSAQFWVSCIRHSLECLQDSFPCWMKKETKWRGMKNFRYADLNSRFEEKSEIAWYTIKSTTWDVQVLQEANSCFCGQTGDRTLFEIEGCDALDISQISKYPEEKECLIVPGSFFKVQSRIQRDVMIDGDPLKTADRVVLKYLGNSIQQILEGLQFTNPAIVVVGNPGSGKSTTLNRYAGHERFEAGFSEGTGLTAELETAEYKREGEKGLLMDTPGLADIDEEKKKSAAAAIFNALMMVENFKLFFVVKLDDGRIRPADVETILKVLKACEDIGNKLHFGLIVNRNKAEVLEDPRKIEVITATFEKVLGLKFSTTLESRLAPDDEPCKPRGRIHFAPEEPDGVLKAEPCTPLSPDTLDFMKELPGTHRVGDIQRVNIEAYKQLAKKVKEMEEKVKMEIKAREEAQSQAAVQADAKEQAEAQTKTAEAEAKEQADAKERAEARAKVEAEAKERANKVTAGVSVVGIVVIAILLHLFFQAQHDVGVVQEQRQKRDEFWKLESEKKERAHTELMEKRNRDHEAHMERMEANYKRREEELLKKAKKDMEEKAAEMKKQEGAINGELEAQRLLMEEERRRNEDEVKSMMESHYRMLEQERKSAQEQSDMMQKEVQSRTGIIIFVLSVVVVCMVGFYVHRCCC